MSDYRRWYIAGGTVFFTLVTYRRYPLFRDPVACQLLGEILRSVREEKPFETVAAALLPDHFHTIWKMPLGDSNYSSRWQQIKRNFTVKWLEKGGKQCRVTPAQANRRTRGIWQRRFYEHQVRDEEELEALCDYIHYNPV